MLLLGATRFASQARAEPARILLRLETGGEYDTNATHEAEPGPQTPGAPTPPPIIASPLWRTTAVLQLAKRISDRQLIGLSQSIGGKIFFADQLHEDVIIDDTHLVWSARASSRVTLELAADYYDAFQDHVYAWERRDFRLGDAGPRLVLGWEGGGSFTASAGYRAFQYKGDETQDFWGPFAGIALGKQWLTGPPEDEHEWLLDASYQINPRTFNMQNLVCETCPPAATTRQDLFQYGELRGTYVGALLFGLAYGLQWNDSSSYGYGLLRHIITGRFATRLPGTLQLALKATLQILALSDPVPVDPLRPESFESENRSSVELSLERPLGESVSVVGRYAFYTSVLGVEPASNFYRHLFFLGIAYTYER